MKLETGTYPQTYTQEVHGESQFFDNIRRFAEFENAGPGEEFHYDVDLIAQDDGVVQVVWLGDPLGYLPAENSAEWWPFVSRMSAVNEGLEVEARIWTSHDWDNNFYGSVRLDLPSLDDAMDAAVGDSLTDFSTRDAMNLMHSAPSPAPRPFASAQPTPYIPAPVFNLQDRNLALFEYEAGRKKGVVAWLLWLFLGGLGGHRFYLGHTGYAVTMLLLNWATIGIWGLIDAFFINRNLRAINTQKWMETASRYNTPIEPLPEGSTK